MLIDNFCMYSPNHLATHTEISLVKVTLKKKKGLLALIYHCLSDAICHHRPGIPFTTRTKSHLKISWSLEDSGLDFSNHSKIWQGPR